MKYKKNELNFTIADTMREVEKDEVIELCEINEWEIPSEDSPAWFEIERDIRDTEWSDFIMNIKNGRKYPVMVTGQLGLWNGNPTIVPEKFDNLYDAVMKCLGRDTWDVDLHYNKGVLEINCHHHDGCNRFEIHKLSKRGIKEVDRPIYYRGEKDYEPKPYWFSQFSTEELEMC